MDAQDGQDQKKQLMQEASLGFIDFVHSDQKNSVICCLRYQDFRILKEIFRLTFYPLSVLKEDEINKLRRESQSFRAK